jgi:hypothetical protein
MARSQPRDLWWSRERWFMTITIVFAVQVVVVIWLGGRNTLTVRSEAKRFGTVQLAAGLSDTLKSMLDLMDPTVFSRANRHGFSGEIWLRFEPVEHRSSGWADEPPFLSFDDDQLLADLEAFGQSAKPQPGLITANASLGMNERLKLPPELRPRTESVMSLSGELQTGDLLEAPVLPVIEHDGVLPASTVTIQVDRRGRVYSARLDSRSGSSSADQMALQIARSLRFGVADGFSPNTDARDFGSFRRAFVTIHWWTVAPPPPEKPPATPVRDEDAPDRAPTVEPVQ